MWPHYMGYEICMLLCCFGMIINTDLQISMFFKVYKPCNMD